MDDMIQFTCPHCGTVGNKSLRLLERVDDIYRGAPDQPAARGGKITEYRAYCSNCGHYVVVKVQED